MINHYRIYYLFYLCPCLLAWVRLIFSFRTYEESIDFNLGSIPLRIGDVEYKDTVLRGTKGTVLEKTFSSVTLKVCLSSPHNIYVNFCKILHHLTDHPQIKEASEPLIFPEKQLPYNLRLARSMELAKPADQFSDAQAKEYRAKVCPIPFPNLNQLRSAQFWMCSTTLISSP